MIKNLKKVIKLFIFKKKFQIIISGSETQFIDFIFFILKNEICLLFCSMNEYTLKKQ
jgi:hypothetical protein